MLSADFSVSYFSWQIASYSANCEVQSVNCCRNIFTDFTSYFTRCFNSSFQWMFIGNAKMYFPLTSFVAAGVALLYDFSLLFSKVASLFCLRSLLSLMIKTLNLSSVYIFRLSAKFCYLLPSRLSVMTTELYSNFLKSHCNSQPWCL